MAAQSERAAIKTLADQRAVLEAEMEAVLSRLNAPGMPGVSGRLVDAEVRACVTRERACSLARAVAWGEALTSAGAAIWRHQGFPRADIDLHAVRNDRHRLAGALHAALSRICLRRAECCPPGAVLKTDYARVSDALERSLHALHAAARASGGAPTAAGAVSEPKRPRLDAADAAVPMETGEAAQAAATPLAAFAVIDEVSADSPAAAAGIAVGDRLIALGDVRCGSGGAAAALAALGPQVAAAEGRALAVEVLRRGERVTLSLTPRRWDGRGLLGCHLRPLS